MPVPYWVGAETASGKAPRVTLPQQAQRTSWTWCSVTSPLLPPTRRPGDGPRPLQGSRPSSRCRSLGRRWEDAPRHGRDDPGTPGDDRSDLRTDVRCCRRSSWAPACRTRHWTVACHGCCSVRPSRRSSPRARVCSRSTCSGALAHRPMISSLVALVARSIRRDHAPSPAASGWCKATTPSSDCPVPDSPPERGGGRGELRRLKLSSMQV